MALAVREVFMLFFIFLKYVGLSMFLIGKHIYYESGCDIIILQSFWLAFYKLPQFDIYFFYVIVYTYTVFKFKMAFCREGQML